MRNITATTPHQTFRSSLYAIVGVALAFTSCASTAEASPPDSLVEPLALTTELDPVQLGICVDASDSVNPAVVAASVDAVTNIDSQLGAIEVGKIGNEGFPGIPPIHLVVRQVAADALGIQNQIRNVQLSGVHVLAAKPGADAGLDNVGSLRDSWSDERQRTEQALVKAIADRRNLERALAGIEFTHAGSEIVGCLTALAATFDSSVRMRLFLITDLDQRGEPQAQGDLSTAEIVVIHDCQDVSVCDAQQQTLRSLLEALRTSPDAITFQPPERLPIELANSLG